MRTKPAALTLVLVLTLAACSSGRDDSGTPAGGAATGPVQLRTSQVETAREDAGCTAIDVAAVTRAEHVDPDGRPADELYDVRPGAAGDHLDRWVEAEVFDRMPDERSVVHNHEHGAVSVWYDADRIDARQLARLTSWAAARNGAGLANDAGAGIVVAPFDEGLDDDAIVALRSWTVAMDCAGFNDLVGDGFLVDAFGNAPEGSLAPPLDTVVAEATTA